MTAEPLTLPSSEDHADAPVKIGLLGPVQMPGGPVPTSRMERQTLALLAWQVNTLTTAGLIIKELWERAPRHAAQSVQTYVYHLRQRLPSLNIQTRPGGYLLYSRSTLDVDVHRFDYLTGLARAALSAGALRRAEDCLRAAFSLWRGPALADTPLGAELSALVTGVEERRLSALDLRFEVDLRLGRHREVVDELSALARRNPAREDTTAKLMLALYRSNRRAEALGAYMRLRQELVAVCGLEPCADLRRLQQQVLAGDPSLEWIGGAS